MTSSNKKRIGEFLILLVYLVIDGYGLWPVSHFWALTGGFIGIVALLFLDGEFSGLQISGIAAIALVGCVVIYVRVPPEPPASDVEVIGTLHAGNDADPTNSCPHSDSPDAWKIMFGDSAVQFSSYAKAPLLKIAQCTVLTLSRDERGISIDADLFDQGGRLIATIDDNRYSALTGSRYHVERDNDLTKVIVKNADDKEVLFVHYLNRSTVRVRGVFGCPGHDIVNVKDGEPIPRLRLHTSCLNVKSGASFGALFAVDPR